MSTTNYYDVLGLKNDCTQKDIKEAYKNLSKKYHPDKETGDEEKFKLINEANSILSDEKKRYEYDNPNLDHFGINIEDVMNFFGGRNNNDAAYQMLFVQQDGRSIKRNITIPFTLFILGGIYIDKFDHDDICLKCNGKGFNIGKKCDNCNGSGQKIITTKSMFGISQQLTNCNICQGKGGVPNNDSCMKCSGAGHTNREREIKINIKKGIELGEQVFLENEGLYGPNGGKNGHILYNVFPNFKLDYNKLSEEEIKILNSLTEKVRN